MCIELPIKLKCDFRNGECDYLVIENIKKWLRDELNIHIMLQPCYSSEMKNNTAYTWVYMQLNGNKRKFDKHTTDVKYATYEEALTECIKGLVEVAETEAV